MKWNSAYEGCCKLINPVTPILCIERDGLIIPKVFLRYSLTYCENELFRLSQPEYVSRYLHTIQADCIEWLTKRIRYLKTVKLLKGD